MATRMIPKSTKVKVEFIKGFNFADIFVILFALVFLALAWTSGFSTIAKLVISGVVLLVFGILFMSIEPGVKMYNQVGDLFKFFFGINTYKKYRKNTGSNKDVRSLFPYIGLLEQDYDEKRKIGIIDYMSCRRKLQS